MPKKKTTVECRVCGECMQVALATVNIMLMRSVHYRLFCACLHSKYGWLFFVLLTVTQKLDEMKAMHKQCNQHIRCELNGERILHELLELITLITSHTIAIMYSISFASFCLLLTSARKMDSQRLPPRWWMLLKRKTLNYQRFTLLPLFSAATTKA